MNQQFVNNFFEEYQKNHLNLFLYEEKQLLNNGNYKAFAERQVEKAKKTSLALSPAMLFAFILGIINLIEYGQTQSWLMLIYGLVCLIFLLLVSLFVTKEYFSIKASMRTFLLKLDASTNKESAT